MAGSGPSARVLAVRAACLGEGEGEGEGECEGEGEGEVRAGTSRVPSALARSSDMCRAIDARVDVACVGADGEHASLGRRSQPTSSRPTSSQPTARGAAEWEAARREG